LVRETLKLFANVNTSDKDGWTPLYIASEKGHIEVVSELLNHGANVNTAAKVGWTTLYIAGQNGHIEVVRELLNNVAKSILQIKMVGLLCTKQARRGISRC